MIITQHEQPFPYLSIENIFNNSQWNGIVRELEWLKQGDDLYKPADETGASHKEGIIQTSKTGLFLENTFIPGVSKTANAIDEVMPFFFTGDEIPWYMKLHQHVHMIRSSLVSYYEQADYYKPHTDDSVYTFLFWYFNEPKSFDGGNVVFTDYDIEVECRPNCGVIFPGPIRHEVTEITNCTEGRGRFAVSTFINPPKFPQNQ